MTDCGAIRSALTTLVGLDKTAAEHVEMSATRMRRDFVDFQKVRRHLMTYSPFKYVDTTRLISLLSGVVAGADDGVNCDEAEDIGNMLQRKWDDSLFGVLTLKKAEQVKTMANVSNVCRIESDSINIDPNTLFHRLIIAGERFGNLRSCFAYKLTPFPASLFKDGLMRKPYKPSLYRDFLKRLVNRNKPTNLTCVTDGGYLLHKVRWSALMNVTDVLQLFSKYVSGFGSMVTVVFDGYSAGPSIKDQEHVRRSLKAGQVAPDRQINYDTKNLGNQEHFLSNVHNKMALITLLSEHLQQCGVTTHQAPGDADTLIAKVAIDAASLLPNSTPVAVITEDTDVLALFLHHRQPGMRDILFVSEPKKVRGGKTSAGKCISVNELQQKIGLDSCSRILAVHAFGGCDSTSAIFGLGKGTVFAKINKDTSLHSHCTTLQYHTASPNAVCEAGVKLMVGICGTNSRESLSDLRYSAFCNTSLSRKFMPERLPPSEDATKLHAKRAHLQAVIWVTLGNSNLVPTDWGWSLSQGRLKPTALDGPVAPDNVLNVVRCKCKGNCSSALCSCRKHGLTCVTACSNCHGAQCTNIQAQEVPSSFDDSDSEPECSAGEPSCEDLGQFFADTNFHLHQLYEEEI